MCMEEKWDIVVGDCWGEPCIKKVGRDSHSFTVTSQQWLNSLWVLIFPSPVIISMTVSPGTSPELKVFPNSPFVITSTRSTCPFFLTLSTSFFCCWITPPSSTGLEVQRTVFYILPSQIWQSLEILPKKLLFSFSPHVAPALFLFVHPWTSHNSDVPPPPESLCWLLAVPSTPAHTLYTSHYFFFRLSLYHSLNLEERNSTLFIFMFPSTYHSAWYIMGVQWTLVTLIV